MLLHLVLSSQSDMQQAHEVDELWGPQAQVPVELGQGGRMWA